MTAFTISGFYGDSNESDIFVCEQEGGYWYCVEGSKNINFTYDESVTEEGVNIENLADADHFTTMSPIYTVFDLQDALEE